MRTRLSNPPEVSISIGCDGILKLNHLRFVSAQGFPLKEFTPGDFRAEKNKEMYVVLTFPDIPALCSKVNLLLRKTVEHCSKS